MADFAQYRDITAKLKKRFSLRKPNFREASDAFKRLSLDIGVDNFPNYAAFCALSAAQCEHNIVGNLREQQHQNVRQQQQQDLQQQQSSSISSPSPMSQTTFLGSPVKLFTSGVATSSNRPLPGFAVNTTTGHTTVSTTKTTTALGSNTNANINSAEILDNKQHGPLGMDRVVQSATLTEFSAWLDTARLFSSATELNAAISAYAHATQICPERLLPIVYAEWAAMLEQQQRHLEAAEIYLEGGLLREAINTLLSGQYFQDAYHCYQELFRYASQQVNSNSFGGGGGDFEGNGGGGVEVKNSFIDLIISDKTLLPSQSIQFQATKQQKGGGGGGSTATKTTTPVTATTSTTSGIPSFFSQLSSLKSNNNNKDIGGGKSKGVDSEGEELKTTTTATIATSTTNISTLHHPPLPSDGRPFAALLPLTIDDYITTFLLRLYLYDPVLSRHEYPNPIIPLPSVVMRSEPSTRFLLPNHRYSVSSVEEDDDDDNGNGGGGGKEGGDYSHEEDGGDNSHISSISPSSDSSTFGGGGGGGKRNSNTTTTAHQQQRQQRSGSTVTGTAKQSSSSSSLVTQFLPFVDLLNGRKYDRTIGEVLQINMLLETLYLSYRNELKPSIDHDQYRATTFGGSGGAGGMIAGSGSLVDFAAAAAMFDGYDSSTSTSLSCDTFDDENDVDSLTGDDNDDSLDEPSIGDDDDDDSVVDDEEVGEEEEEDSVLDRFPPPMPTLKMPASIEERMTQLKLMDENTPMMPRTTYDSSSSPSSLLSSSTNIIDSKITATTINDDGGGNIVIIDNDGPSDVSLLIQSSDGDDDQEKMVVAREEEEDHDHDQPLSQLSADHSIGTTTTNSSVFASPSTTVAPNSVVLLQHQHHNANNQPRPITGSTSTTTSSSSSTTTNQTNHSTSMMVHADLDEISLRLEQLASKVAPKLHHHHHRRHHHHRNRNLRRSRHHRRRRSSKKQRSKSTATTQPQSSSKIQSIPSIQIEDFNKVKNNNNDHQDADQDDDDDIESEMEDFTDLERKHQFQTRMLTVHGDNDVSLRERIASKLYPLLNAQQNQLVNLIVTTKE